MDWDCGDPRHRNPYAHEQGCAEYARLSMSDWDVISGSGRLLEWFGEWPNFHDAEVLELYLSRNGVSRIRIQTWLTSDVVDERGYFRRDKETVVTFHLTGIVDLEIKDFSVQNVLACVEVSAKQDVTRLVLWPCYGLGGYIEARHVEVGIEPTRAA